MKSKKTLICTVSALLLSVLLISCERADKVPGTESAEMTTQVSSATESTVETAYHSSDPSPCHGIGEYTIAENTQYLSFYMRLFFDPQAIFKIHCTDNDLTLSNVMICTTPSVEWQDENGEWKKLTYAPSDRQHKDQWIAFKVDSENPFLEIDIYDIVDPPIGKYRIILYVCGQTENGSQLHLQYIFCDEIPYVRQYLQEIPLAPAPFTSTTATVTSEAVEPTTEEPLPPVE